MEGRVLGEALVESVAEPPDAETFVRSVERKITPGTALSQVVELFGLEEDEYCQELSTNPQGLAKRMIKMNLDQLLGKETDDV